MDHGYREFAGVGIGALQTDHLLHSAKKRSQQTYAKDEVHGRPSIGEQLVHRLQLSFARRSLFLPEMKVFGVANYVLHQGGQMKEGGFGDVLIVGERDQIPRQCNVRGAQGKNLARCQHRKRRRAKRFRPRSDQ